MLCCIKCCGVFLQGKTLYKVRWKGYTSDDDTWEPEAHLEDCKEVLLEFRKKIVDNKPKSVKKEIQVCFNFSILPWRHNPYLDSTNERRGEGKAFETWI